MAYSNCCPAPQCSNDCVAPPPPPPVVPVAVVTPPPYNVVPMHTRFVRHQNWQQGHHPHRKPYRSSRLNLVSRDKKYYYKDSTGQKYSYKKTPKGQ